jgi:hypothetical protein
MGLAFIACYPLWMTDDEIACIRARLARCSWRHREAGT